MGKCPDCGAWDALEEYRVDAATAKDPQRGLAQDWRLADVGEDVSAAPTATPLHSAESSGATASRLSTGIGEFDRVLGFASPAGAPAPGTNGAGLVPGSAILLGGGPGIGKSTLALQALGAMASRGVRCLYVTSEESADQVRLRAERLGVAGCADLFVLADTNLARIVEQARRVEPAVVVIDSIQLIYKADLDASPGSVTQLRRCCTELVYLAKSAGVVVILVGHITKDGRLAGPRLLEHLVDVVLSFEGDRYHAHRVVRAAKNRFGTTLEIGLFEMGAAGLIEVPEGSSVTAGSYGAEPRPGSVVCPVVTGTRCILVELQALTATGFPGATKRKSSGLDPNRLAMLIAVLEQHSGLRLFDRDVFASAVGGVRVVEPAADLALALAVAGAELRRALPPSMAVVGEVGLGGEVRPVPQMEARAREAARLGYRTLLVPALPGGKPAAIPTPGIEIIAAPTLGRAMDHLAPARAEAAANATTNVRRIAPARDADPSGRARTMGRGT